MIVILSVVLIVVLLSYARGERQRGEDVTEASGITAVVV